MLGSDGSWESCRLGASACGDDEGQDTSVLALQFIYILLALALQRKAPQQINRSQMQQGLALRSWQAWDTALHSAACRQPRSAPPVPTLLSPTGGEGRGELKAAAGTWVLARIPGLFHRQDPLMPPIHRGKLRHGAVRGTHRVITATCAAGADPHQLCPPCLSPRLHSPHNPLRHEGKV